MKSPWRARALSVGSASGDRRQRPTPAGRARPRASSLRSRASLTGEGAGAASRPTGRRSIRPSLRPALRSEEAVEPGPAIGRCVLGQASGDLAFAAGTELALDQGFGAAAQTLGDIVAADDQIGAGIVDAAHDQMDMGMGRVPVIDGDPVEARVEIGLHGLDQVAGETPQIRYLVGVFGRDD